MMDSLSFALVVASAFTHASWNVLAKRSGDKESFMWLMSFTSFFTLLPVFYFILPDWRLPASAVPYLIVTAVAQVLYYVSLGRAYELGDLSVVYPLARSSPLFLTILAVALLGERISAWGVTGIILILLGVYTIHLRSFSTDDLLLPLRSLKDRPSQLALLTALWTTVYSLSDKVGVTKVNPLIYAFWLEVFILVPLTPVIVYRRGWSAIAGEWGASRSRVTVAGFLMKFGYVLVLVAMSLVQVSYILALRQLSVILGVAAGVLFLGEGYGRVRLLSSIIMFLGVYILAVMA